MTSEVVAVTVEGADNTSVDSAAGALAEILRAEVRRVVIDPAWEPGDWVDDLVNELSAPTTVLGVMSAQAGGLHLTRAVLARADKPMVVVPAEGRRRRQSLGRALLPLDGTPESAAAVSGTMSLLAEAGVDVVVLHVFDSDTVPQYWDHGGHAEQAWQGEFIARYCGQSQVRLELRNGVPGQSVADVAETEDVDLIALGWSRSLEPGRATTVRAILERSAVPVLLIPVLAQAGAGAARARDERL
jgi:nucleotide-binding universal stress UspA family protein